jgi:hypothetical protein
MRPSTQSFPTPASFYSPPLHGINTPSPKTQKHPQYSDRQIQP